MTIEKRVFDFVCASILLVLLLPVLAYIAARIWQQKDGPIFYLSERMRTPDQGFQLIKFRTMRSADPSENGGVTGNDKSDRITPLGEKLRRLRLDELPQLWNVIKGDVSFVGPRPPLRYYVDKFPEYYDEVLKSRPGVTGLATLKFHRREADLLAECHSPTQTDAVYVRRCVPIKAKLDLIYQKNYSPCFDYWIIWRTLYETFSAKHGS